MRKFEFDALGGALEVINDWSYAVVDAPVLDDADDDIWLTWNCQRIRGIVNVCNTHKRKERDAIIQSLKSGVTPRIGIQHIQLAA